MMQTLLKTAEEEKRKSHPVLPSHAMSSNAQREDSSDLTKKVVQNHSIGHSVLKVKIRRVFDARLIYD